jgi:hypothetical protein
VPLRPVQEQPRISCFGPPASPPGTHLNISIGTMMTKMTRTRVALALTALALPSLAFVPASGRTPKDKSQKKDSVVYVCACLKTKSCSCMSEAKTEGPCSCGTEGGPPMKAVGAHSDWAKQNRDALAQ